MDLKKIKTRTSFFVTCSDSHSFSSRVEEELYKLGQWTFVTMQLIGYFPFGFSPSSGFKFKFLSSLILSFLILLLSSLYWNFHNYKNWRRFTRILRISGPTELFAHTLMVLIISFTCLATRLRNIFSVSSTLSFWHSNCALFSILTRNGVELCGKYRPMFLKIKNELKIRLALFLLPSLLHIIFVHGYFLIESYKSKRSSRMLEIEFYLGTGFWVWLAFFHASYTVWMIYFMKLYAAGFEIISREMDLDDGFLKTKDFPQIYIMEISGVKKFRFPSEKSPALLEEKIRDCLNNFQVLEEQCRVFNRFFGKSIILELTNAIVSLLAFCFFAILWIGKGHIMNLVSLFVPIFFFTLLIYSLGTEADRVTSGSQNILKKLLKLPLHTLSTEIQMKIQLFGISVATNPPVISAGNFFTLNRRLITSILCAMTTFLIVLVQFKETDEENKPTTQLPPPIFNNNV